MKAPLLDTGAQDYLAELDPEWAPSLSHPREHCFYLEKQLIKQCFQSCVGGKCFLNHERSQSDLKKNNWQNLLPIEKNPSFQVKMLNFGNFVFTTITV